MEPIELLEKIIINVVSYPLYQLDTCVFTESGNRCTLLVSRIPDFRLVSALRSACDIRANLQLRGANLRFKFVGSVNQCYHDVVY
jgi:hypothetical protein